MTSDVHVDALIIGTGISGLSAAMKLIEGGRKVLLVTRESRPEETNTSYAQGGIIYAPGDSMLGDDIQRASAQTSLDEAILQVLRKSPSIVEEALFEKAKTPFEKNEKGELCFTKEAAHSKERILYKGDFTGKAIQVSMLNYLKDAASSGANIEFLTECTAVDLITPNHHGIDLTERSRSRQVVGAYLYSQKEKTVIRAFARSTFLATGGVGSLYLHHSNSEGARGDGHAMAIRAGAWHSNMEFIQFHPTTFFESSSHRRFLISEAVRGEGGVLINSEGESFMEGVHPDKELAPRDVVARAILDETLRTGHECVYLDISHKSEEHLRKRFPTIFNYCLKRGINIAEGPIPVVPAAHYTCGGIWTGENGETNLPGLYAVGEVACTGLHGANRLASTSLLEGLTWGHLAAEHFLKEGVKREFYDAHKIREWASGGREPEAALIRQDRITLKQTMWNYVGLIRTRERLQRAWAVVDELEQEVQHFYRNADLTDELIGLRNSVEIARHIISASMRNPTSVGCFFREN